MDEAEFLREGAILVTTNRIELDGQTFAVRNIGSVKVTRPGTPIWALVVGILGAAMGANPDTRIFGVMVLLAAGLWVWQQVRIRRLVLVSGGGESVALQSTNGALIERVRAAIAQAISAR
nr:DUF6232 family protein [uncultured Roseateles sp.]